MIWISNVLPPSTKEELPPKERDFRSSVGRTENNFQKLLDEELQKIKERSAETIYPKEAGNDL